MRYHRRRGETKRSGKGPSAHRFVAGGLPLSCCFPSPVAGLARSSNLESTSLTTATDALWSVR